MRLSPIVCLCLGRLCNFFAKTKSRQIKRNWFMQCTVMSLACTPPFRQVCTPPPSVGVHWCAERHVHAQSHGYYKSAGTTNSSQSRKPLHREYLLYISKPLFTHVLVVASARRTLDLPVEMSFTASAKAIILALLGLSALSAVAATDRRRPYRPPAGVYTYLLACAARSTKPPPTELRSDSCGT